MDQERRCDLTSCKKPLVRKTGETAQNFLTRRHCDKRCAATNDNQKRIRRRRYGLVQERGTNGAPGEAVEKT